MLDPAAWNRHCHHSSRSVVGRTNARSEEMSKVSKQASHQLSQQQWSAVATAGIAGTAAAGPIGAACAVIGMAAGCVASNFFGYDESGQSSNSNL